MRDPSSRELDNEKLDVGAIFDEVFAEMLAEERANPRAKSDPPPIQSPEVAAACEALRQMFEGNNHLTADLSFDQVYAKVLTHLIVIFKDIQLSKGVAAGMRHDERDVR